MERLLTFRAAPSRGGMVGLLGVVLGLLLEVALVLLVARLPIGPTSALLGLVALAVLPLWLRWIFWVWGYFRLRYEVTRDGVIVHWAASRQVIPMGDIERVRSGRPYVGRFRGVRWAGYQVGHVGVDLGEGAQSDVLVYATTPPEGQLLLLTAGGVGYGLSPAAPQEFIEELQRRRRLGIVQQLEQHTERSAILRLPVWSDQATLRILAAATMASALLFALIAFRYPSLPGELALRYRFDGIVGVAPAGQQPRGSIWVLPEIGLLLLALDALLALAVHHRARLGAQLLATAALSVQLLIGLLLTRIL